MHAINWLFPSDILFGKHGRDDSYRVRCTGKCNLLQDRKLPSIINYPLDK